MKLHYTLSLLNQEIEMGQNLSNTREADTSPDILSPFRRQEKTLLILWLATPSGMAIIRFTVLLCDRWERRGRSLGLVLEALSLSILWPLVLLYLLISDDWDMWRVGT